jgi:hypothetical protein
MSDINEKRLKLEQYYPSSYHISYIIDSRRKKRPEKKPRGCRLRSSNNLWAVVRMDLEESTLMISSNSKQSYLL